MAPPRAAGARDRPFPTFHATMIRLAALALAALSLTAGSARAAPAPAWTLPPAIAAAAAQIYAPS